MDQKVANSTVRDSINTMPWIIVTMALLNITVSLNYWQNVSIGPLSFMFVTDWSFKFFK
jgi:hypothetical protein